MSGYETMIIDVGNPYSNEEIYAIINELKTSKKAVMIVGMSASQAIMIAAQAEKKQIEDLNKIIIECCKEPYDYYSLDDEPLDRQPFVETHREVKDTKQHKIWDYG